MSGICEFVLDDPTPGFRDGFIAESPRGRHARDATLREFGAGVSVFQRMLIGHERFEEIA